MTYVYLPAIRLGEIHLPDFASMLTFSGYSCLKTCFSQLQTLYMPDASLMKESSQSQSEHIKWVGKVISAFVEITVKSK